MPSRETEDQRQFREYFAARREVVRRTAYVLCGDWHWADDLTQTAFMRLVVSWRKVRDQQSLDAYVRTCLVRTYLSEAGRMWRRREWSTAEPPERAVPADPTDSTAGLLTFAAALRRLPARQRAVLVCRYYQDLDVATTAATLGCSVGTVKSHTARGLTRLRELLGQDDELTTVGGEQ